MKNKMVLTLYSILIIGFMSLTFIGCDMLNDILNKVGGSNDFIPTNEQMVTALKEALSTGSNDAGATLSVKGAFNENLARRIPLPDEVKNMMTTLNALQPINAAGFNISASTVINTIGGQDALEDLRTSINTAAEDASKSVAQIFASAVLSMTFADAKNILLGTNTEATDYFKLTTTDPLIDAFSPVLDEALGKNLIGNISAKSAWNGIVDPYNEFANNYNATVTNSLVILAIGKRDKLDIVNTDLSEFVLEKALTAVFNEIAEMEKEIREDPLKFLSNLFSDISAKVFDWAKSAIGS